MKADFLWEYFVSLLLEVWKGVGWDIGRRTWTAVFRGNWTTMACGCGPSELDYIHVYIYI